MLTYYKTLRFYVSPNTAWCSVEYAVLSVSARDPYWPENNGEKKMSTYFNHDTADGADVAVGGEDVEAFNSGSWSSQH
jgi:hypothetical protein